LLQQAAIYRRFSKAMSIGSLGGDEEILEQTREALFAAEQYVGPRILDVGAGAGYPTVAVALMRPELEIVLLERREKVASYLEYLVANLGLSRLRVVMENLGGRLVENPLDGSLGSFDTIIFRAVPELSGLCRTASNMLTPRGRLLLFVGRSRTERLVGVLSELGYCVSAKDERWTKNKVILIAKRRSAKRSNR